jgi:hypothetical protein
MLAMFKPALSARRASRRLPYTVTGGFGAARRARLA